jgi:hypothetical protein
MGQQDIALDFSGLEDIGRTRRAQEAAKDFDQGELSLEKENTSQGRTDTAEGKPPTYHRIDQAKAEREALNKAYQEQQENIRRAGNLRGEITRGVRAGQDPGELLLKALECISLMTGDRVFYEQNRQDLANLFGVIK